MRPEVMFVLKLVIAALAVTVVTTAAWQWLVAGVLYECTDGGVVDFLYPGFVHGTDGALLYGDTVRRGWTLAGIWRLWWFSVVASVALSILLACVPWLPSAQTGVPDSDHEQKQAA